MPTVNSISEVIQKRELALVNGPLTPANQRQREEAIAKYNKISPKCKFCEKLLPIPERRPFGHGTIAKAGRRKFCGPACVSHFRWKQYREALGDPEYLTQAERRALNKSRVPLRKKSEVHPKQIGAHARKVYIEKIGEGDFLCERCGLNNPLLLDVAHIKAVAEFGSEEILLTINAPDNLIGLCKNCHWEFDQKQKPQAISGQGAFC